MMRRLASLAVVAAIGMVLGGCAEGDVPLEGLEQALTDFEAAFEGAEGGPPGPGTGGPDPTGTASSGDGGGDGGGGDGGPPTDGWPPNAGPGPSATPSDTYSDPDGTTYADYDFESASEQEDWLGDTSHKLKESGFEPDLGGARGDGSDESRLEVPFTNEETGETVWVGYESSGEGGGTTYIP